MQLYDYGLSTLEQYGLKAETTARTRGALLCHTEKGLLILKEFAGSEKKLGKQQELLLILKEKGIRVDSYLPNQEGSLVSRDKDDVGFTLQYWYEGRECDTKSREDILRSVSTLANLHTVMKLTPAEEYREKSLREVYVRHNQEIRKIRKFIRKKGASGVFEKEFLASVEWFLKRGELALEMLEDSGYEELREKSWQEGEVCHGEYSQHNVLMMKDGAAVTNFGHWNFDIQMSDLYRFMRKILEKYNWDLALAREMLRTYHRIRPISRMEWDNLRVRFVYPEKYWKLANYYYSHNKAWISEKNTEKLKVLIKQSIIWEKFGEKCFGIYPF